MTQFESYVFWKSKKGTDLEHHDTNKNEEIDEGVKCLESIRNCDMKKILWWEPHGNSWLHDFFGYSAIHGLKYISRRKLSLPERLSRIPEIGDGIFWILSIILSIFGAGVMISQVWNRYHESPVIVTFNPTEEETVQLPFPGVTICNKSLFSKKKVVELLKELETGSHKTGTMEKLRLVNALCTSRQSFLRRMHLVKTEEYPNWDEINQPPSPRTVDGIVNFIFDFSQPCSELLRGCSWDRKKRNCSDLFRPILTDYGKCCVFNKIPNELMDFERNEVTRSPKRERGWSYEEIIEWQKWDYIKDGFMIRSAMKYPLRQKKSGSLNGLSVLLDPDVDNGYCQSQDSMGVRILLHTSADTPRISHMGTGFGLEREIFIKVFPDSTVADQSILDYDYEDRKCIFGQGKIFGNQFLVDKPYTRNNCFITCQQRHIKEMCNCTVHHARRQVGFRICNPSPNSPDFQCVRNTEVALAGNLKRDCSMCIYSCNYLKYHVESTEANLLDPAELWGDNETNQPPTWSEHKLSISHIFMGSEMHVPKVRQKLYNTVDLIASIGGLLSLTLGFSVLAVVEILYLLTLRICCKRLRRHMQTPPEESRFH